MVGKARFELARPRASGSKPDMAAVTSLADFMQLIYVLMELPTTLGFLCLYLTSLATSYVSHIVV